MASTADTAPTTAPTTNAAVLPGMQPASATAHGTPEHPGSLNPFRPPNPAWLTEPVRITDFTAHPPGYPTLPTAPPAPTSPGGCVTEDDARLSALPTERLEAELMSTAAHLAAGTCRFLLLIAEHDRRAAWEDWECRSMAHWLSFKCGLSMSTARDHVRTARRLIDMPMVRSEFARGALSYSKVRALARVCQPTNEADLLSIALHATASQLERACSHLRRIQDVNAQEDALHDAETDARRRKHFTLGSDESGDGTGRFHLPGHEMEVLQRALATASHDLHERDQSASNAAALLELARAYLANPHTGPGPQPEIIVHFDASAVVAARAGADAGAHAEPHRRDRGDGGHGSDSGTSEHTDQPDQPDQIIRSHWPVRSAVGRLFSLALLNRLACNAGIRTVADLPDGTQLNVGRHRRTPTPEQRRALTARDLHCRFPGCETRHRLHAHHIVWWSLGGSTDIDNLLLLCPKHHHAIHDRQWCVTGTATSPTFTRPDGQSVPPAQPRSSGTYDDLMVTAAALADAHGHPDLDVEFPGGRWLGDHIDWDWFFTGLASQTANKRL